MHQEIRISVTATGETIFEVRVEGVSVTSHEVVLVESYYQKLTGGRVTPEKLLEASFRFLLERESNTSILRQFDLPLISRYFPEYEETIKKVLA